MPIPSVPSHLDWRVRNFLEALRQAVIDLTPSTDPPIAPTNLQVTPIAYGNVIRFTRSNGDKYYLYLGDSANLALAVVVDLGQANEYKDMVGNKNITRTYWVAAVKGGVISKTLGPISGTTLDSNVPTTLPTPPPPTSQPPSGDGSGGSTGGLLPGL